MTVNSSSSRERDSSLSYVCFAAKEVTVRKMEHIIHRQFSIETRHKENEIHLIDKVSGGATWRRPPGGDESNRTESRLQISTGHTECSTPIR